MAPGQSPSVTDVGRIGSGPRIVGRLGSGPRLVGRMGLGVRVSASFQKLPTLFNIIN